MDNMTYEIFIKRAWKCDRFKKGADTDIWNRLLTNNAKYNQHTGLEKDKEKLRLDYNSQFDKVKKYIDDAYNNLLKRDIQNNGSLNVNQILDFKSLARDSATPEILFTILRNSIELMNKIGF